jgi:AcrR family transcriptional regulator
MAYEVTKTIAGRSYRYAVERVVDPATGKRRSRWTYLGRAGSAPAPTPRPRRSDGRERLLDALERLLARSDFGAITAGAVAAEAGFAHGTFYRHFRDKRDALRAALERSREQRSPLVEMLLENLADVDEARAALRAFVSAVLRAPAQHRALLRTWYILSLSDEEAARLRRERKAKALEVLGGFFRALDARGFAQVPDPDTSAAAVLALVEGIFRDAVLEGNAIEEPRVVAVTALVERAIFGTLPGR